MYKEDLRYYYAYDINNREDEEGEKVKLTFNF